jgi:hypothetical protein
MGSFDVQQFLSFIQADGYEPLTVEAVVYNYADKDKAAKAAADVTDDPVSEQSTFRDISLPPAPTQP